MSVLSPMAARGQCQAARRQPRRRDAESRGFCTIPKVAVGEMMTAALERTCVQVAGRHVLAIQDTSSLRVDEKGQVCPFIPSLRWMPARGRSLA